MGSGLSPSGSNTPSNETIKKRYGVDPSKIKVFEGDFYYDADRDKAKLPSDVLLAFDRYNNFSKDQDPDIQNNLYKAKATKNIKSSHHMNNAV